MFSHRYKKLRALLHKMNQALLEKIQNLIEEEVRVQINRYAQIISKRHDISLRLLLHDMENLNTSPEVSTRCLGITGKLEGPLVPQVEYFVCFGITSDSLASLIRQFTGKKTQCLAAGKSLGAPPLVRIFVSIVWYHKWLISGLRAARSGTDRPLRSFATWSFGRKVRWVL
jgi:hypothetical protein